MIFADKEPEKLNLAAVAEVLMGTPLEKTEQSSIWSQRPLRSKQQMYAARDSFSVLIIAQKVENRINE